MKINPFSKPTSLAFKLSFLIHVFLVPGSFVLLYSCKSNPKSTIEAALLEQDWQKVFVELKQDDSLLTKPETVGLLGHSYIMLNRNNASYILLNSISLDSVKRKGWQVWADDFVSRYPSCAVAHYLQGDALMRTGNKEKAIGCFFDALEKDPKCALALNARGIVYALLDSQTLAYNDFKAACAINSSTAEFFVSRGTWYFNKSLREKAFSDFSVALSLAPSNALALNGRACSMLSTASSRTKELYDSIGAFFYAAQSALDLPFFKVNNRNLLLYIENYMFPNEIESPLFRSSDFFDWDLLKSRCNSDSSDILRLILNEPLPSRPSASFLMNLNNALYNSSLFETLLDHYSSADPLPAIIAASERVVAKLPNDPDRKVLVLNRLILEGLYRGLIASYRSRNLGMNLSAQSSPFANSSFYDPNDRTPFLGPITVPSLPSPNVATFSPSLAEIPILSSPGILAAGAQHTSDAVADSHSSLSASGKDAGGRLPGQGQRPPIRPGPNKPYPPQPTTSQNSSSNSAQAKPQIPNGILASTSGPGKRGGRGGGITKPPSWDPPPPIRYPPGPQPKPGPKPGSGPPWPPPKPESNEAGGLKADPRTRAVDSEFRLFSCFYSLYYE